MNLAFTCVTVGRLVLLTLAVGVTVAIPVQGYTLAAVASELRLFTRVRFAVFLVRSVVAFLLTIAVPLQGDALRSVVARELVGGARPKIYSTARVSGQHLIVIVYSEIQSMTIAAVGIRAEVTAQADYVISKSNCL